MKDQPEMIRRVAAAQATLDRFKDKPFRLGQFDCVRMTAHHLRKLGYKVKLPPAGAYASRRKALAMLRERGHENLAAALDDLGLERIPPASALVGDVVQLPAVDELGALAIMLSNGRIVGYHQDAPGAVVLQPLEWVGAWRVKA